MQRCVCGKSSPNATKDALSHIAVTSHVHRNLWQQLLYDNSFTTFDGASAGRRSLELPRQPIAANINHVFLRLKLP